MNFRTITNRFNFYSIQTYDIQKSTYEGSTETYDKVVNRKHFGIDNMFFNSKKDAKEFLETYNNFQGFEYDLDYIGSAYENFIKDHPFSYKIFIYNSKHYTAHGFYNDYKSLIKMLEKFFENNNFLNSTNEYEYPKFPAFEKSEIPQLVEKGFKEAESIYKNFEKDFKYVEEYNRNVSNFKKLLEDKQYYHAFLHLDMFYPETFEIKLSDY